MERITRKDLDQALAAHVSALHRAGVTYDNTVSIATGSKVNGNAYRIYRGTVPFSGAVGGDFLGMTAREAYDNLTLRTRVLNDLAYTLREQAREAWITKTDSASA